MSQIEISTPSNKSSEEINNTYDKYERNFTNILNKQAPTKSRYPRKNPLPCMNGELRKAIYHKQMLYNQYTKQGSNKSWEKYCKQRNLVTKLKRKSVKIYFLERCSGGSKSGDFWKTVKPFFSKKCHSWKQKIILCENDKMIQKKFQIYLTHFFLRLLIK